MLIENRRFRGRTEDLLAAAAPILDLGRPRRDADHQSDVARDAVFGFGAHHVMRGVVPTGAEGCIVHVVTHGKESRPWLPRPAIVGRRRRSSRRIAPTTMVGSPARRPSPVA